MFIAIIARICHEANRTLCATQGDNSQARWENTPEWQKDSAIAGVRAIICNPDLTPEQSHEGWSAHKVADGWTYGEQKSAVLKTHPCLVQYSELPKDQQMKDHLFGHVARSLIPFMDKGTIDVIRNNSSTSHVTDEGSQETIDFDSTEATKQSEGIEALGEATDLDTVVAQLAAEDQAQATANEGDATGREQDPESQPRTGDADGTEDGSRTGYVAE